MKAKEDVTKSHLCLPAVDGESGPACLAELHCPLSSTPSAASQSSGDHQKHEQLLFTDSKRNMHSWGIDRTFACLKRITRSIQDKQHVFCRIACIVEELI